MGLTEIFSQIFPPKPQFTEKSIPDLQGKVYIVTGSNTGVGKEVARILYSKNAKVYVAARSKDKANLAIEDIKHATPNSNGSLEFLHLDLSDLTTIKKSAAEFLAKENKLHVLFNNAGVMMPPQGSKTAQGYELSLGVNNIAPFLFTRLLSPLLIATAAQSPTNTVRVVWVASSAVDFSLNKNDIFPLDNLEYKHEKSAEFKYAFSKAGNYLHGVEFARRYKEEGVVSVSLNPGNLSSELVRHKGVGFRTFKSLLDYPCVNGAYTELFAGLSPAVTVERSGEWIVPWGRFMPMRKELIAAGKMKEEGGTGVGLKFWEWTEAQIKPYI